MEVAAPQFGERVEMVALNCFLQAVLSANEPESMIFVDATAANGE